MSKHSTENHHSFGDKSTSIKACDYYDNTSTMVIHFTSGQVYHYPDCPKEEYHNLKAAESIGKYFHSNVRKYKSIKVT